MYGTRTGFEISVPRSGLLVQVRVPLVAGGSCSYSTIGPKNLTYGTYVFRTDPLYAFKTVRPTPVPTFFRAKIVGTGTPDNVGSKKSSNGGGGGLYSVSRCR